jgi:dihydrofolate synthase / folylpolyglutamate synthase
MQRPVIISELQSEARNVIEKEAKRNEAPLYTLGKHFQVHQSNDGDTYINHEKGIRIDQLHRALLGNHQGANMALAITAFIEVAKVFELTMDFERIRDAIKKTKVPGRFEEVLEHVYFDGAHNPESVEMLVQTIQQHFPNDRIRIVMGMLADKDVKKALTILETISDEFYFVDFSNPRAMNAEKMMQLSNASRKQVIQDEDWFLQQCSKMDGKTIVTGSLYLLAEIRQSILKRELNR